MDIEIEPGRYVVAVSGGVDSVVLLHVLASRPGMLLVVAHFDHGTRPDSAADRQHVRRLASEYGLPFVYDEGRLGSGASEAAARRARYDFLHKAREAAGADAVITAHHKDDVLETAIINIVRGTGRKGLAGLRSSYSIQRPLLSLTKAEIISYAKKHGLKWREDSTNTDTAYLRNHIRHKIIPRLSDEHIAGLHESVARAARLNQEIDRLLDAYLERYADGNKLDAKSFLMLPHAAAREVMAAWLRANNIGNFDKKMLERLAHGAKIHKTGSKVDVNQTTALRIYGTFLALEHKER